MVVNDIQKDDKDLTGSVFGRWTVQYLAPIRKDRRTTWHCLCACGKEHDVVERDLLSGKSLSCGCYAIERMNQAHTTHGDTNGEYKRLLTIWRNMIARCSNEHASSYQDYGGRGISVCDEWQDYPTFKEWALAHGYENDLTIERVDVNGNYGPDNCKWIPRAEQARNKRNTVRIHTDDGLTTMRELCETADIPVATYEARVKKLHWSHERAITEPVHNVKQKRHFITFNGETHSIAEWSRITGIRYDTLRVRLVQKGWTPERALTEPVHGLFGID